MFTIEYFRCLTLEAVIWWIKLIESALVMTIHGVFKSKTARISTTSSKLDKDSELVIFELVWGEEIRPFFDNSEEPLSQTVVFLFVVNASVEFWPDKANEELEAVHLGSWVRIGIVEVQFILKLRWNELTEIPLELGQSHLWFHFLRSKVSVCLSELNSEDSVDFINVDCSIFSVEPLFNLRLVISWIIEC